MNIDDKPHKFVSYPLKEAWHRFGDTELLEAWKNTSEKIRRLRHPGIEDHYVPDRVKRRRRIALKKPDDELLARKIHFGIKRNLKNGYLTAWGREVRPTGDWTQIPVDAWDYLNLNFRKGVASIKDGDMYFSVRISRSVILNDRWERGLILQDAEELLAGYEKLDAEFTKIPEYSDGPVDGSTVISAWQRIERSVLHTRDLFMWTKSPANHSWVKLGDTHDAIIPIFESIDFEASTIFVASLTTPSPCLISNASALPSGGLQDFKRKNSDRKVNYLFKQDSEIAYKRRAKELSESEQSSSREEDEKWAREKGISRERVRELREDFAPDSWKKDGPKTKQK